MKIPFRDLRPEAWMNLALAGLVAFYLGQIVSAWLRNSLFQPMALDYLGFWSTGRAATVAGYAHAYDVPLLAQLQVQELVRHGISAEHYAPVPAPLFAVFLVPFQLLAWLHSETSYWVWSACNLVALVIYLVYFVRQVGGAGKPQSASTRALVFLLLSYPVFLNIYWGQIEVFLLICCGEFIRNALRGRPVLAGLWLGGLLAKPQVLVLVLPALLLMKNWRVIGGFLAASLGVLAASLALAGVGGMQAMVRLWLNYLPGMASNAPEIMSNWRMLGFHFNALISPAAGWAVVVLGMAASLLIWTLLWRERPPFGSLAWVLVMGGVFAISCAFTWHSHMHLMMVLIPFLLVAAMRGALPARTYETWALVPPVVLVLTLLATLVVTRVTAASYPFGSLVMGLAGLALNVWLALVMRKGARTANERLTIDD